MIEFGKSICANFLQAASREWLQTNGLGGFASSTVAGVNTRRYHALLTAATKPPVARMVLLSKLEEVLIVQGARFELSTNQYPGAIHPLGFRYLKHFRLDPFPVFVYEIEGIELEKTIFMVSGENTTAVEYRLSSGPPDAEARLELLPLIAFRDYHSLTHENSALRSDFTLAPGLCSFQPYNAVPTLFLAHNAVAVDKTGYWYRNFEYEVERERGLDFREDLFNPCALNFEVSRSHTAIVIASTEAHKAGDFPELKKKELERRRIIEAQCGVSDSLARQLTVAADQYIVARGDHKTIIAGYPWFSDWGRDTMIALPGIALATGRFDVARDLLRTFTRSVDRGMLPNRFPDIGEQPEYNTVDATLWFFEAIRAYTAYTHDFDFARLELYPTLADIISWHVRGTRYHIRVDSTGLLYAGEPGVQLTWMDAKIDDWVVTPRYGKPVEIQALWYNALRIMEDFARRFGDPAGKKTYSSMATFARWSFNRLFWNRNAGCLYDVVNGAPDASIRPNQILAASLHYTMLTDEATRNVVDVVERELLTPYGLRTLAASDPRYHARYQGDVRSRDSAYHQGTVWPWLMGPFITAYVRSRNGSAASRQQAGKWISGFCSHLSEAGLGQVSEIFDAKAPHIPRGCFAQAWSVAELLRALVEDIYVMRGHTPASGEELESSAVSA